MLTFIFSYKRDKFCCFRGIKLRRAYVIAVLLLYYYVEAVKNIYIFLIHLTSPVLFIALALASTKVYVIQNKHRNIF